MGIDASRCRSNLSPGPLNPKMSKYVLCIDLERGAHPLRIEHLVFPPDVAGRTDSIELESFPIPGGKRVWLPISGVNNGLILRRGEYATKPIWQETCKVVRSSIVFNQVLPDRFFSVKKDSQGKTAGLVLKNEFEDLLSKSPPRVRTDPKSVEDRLSKQLDEADRQAKMLEAPSPERTFWSPTLLTQSGFLVLGIALILWVTILIRKSR